jgi:hypothetical protein
MTWRVLEIWRYRGEMMDQYAAQYDESDEEMEYGGGGRNNILAGGAMGQSDKISHIDVPYSMSITISISH